MVRVACSVAIFILEVGGGIINVFQTFFYLKIIEDINP